jgi:hypothetical protein
MGQAEQDYHDMTANTTRTGQAGNRKAEQTGKTGQAEQERQNRTGKVG